MIETNKKLKGRKEHNGLQRCGRKDYWSAVLNGSFSGRGMEK